MKAQHSARNICIKLASSAAIIMSLNACYKDETIEIPSAEEEAAKTPYKSVGNLDSIAASTDTPPAVESGSASSGTAEETSPVTAPPSTSNGSESNNTETPPKEQSPVVVIVPNGRYFIQGVGSKKCIDVDGGKSDNNIQLQIWGCIPSNPNQTMTIEFVEQNYYRITTANNKSVEGKKDNLTPGSPVQQGSNGSLTSQQFSFEKSKTSDNYLIKLRGLDLVIDVAGSQTGDGSALQFAPAKSATNQEWILVKQN